MRRLKLVIADDHRLMLSALRLALENEPEIEIVGEATDGSAVLPLVARVQPDLVLLDVKMPRMDGLACLEHLRNRHPEVRTAILSAVDDPEVVRAAFRHGAAAFILKRIDPADLAAAIRQAMDTTVYQPFGGAEEAEARTIRASGLTERELEIARAVARGLSNAEIARELYLGETTVKSELEILELVAEGKSNKQIAGQLFLAVQTVKFHLTSLYRKLDAKTRTEAVREAYRQGLLDAPLLERVG
jgi:DNA-binding NarL/FixJ family response regulator